MKTKLVKQKQPKQFVPFNLTLEVKNEEQLRGLMALALTNTTVPRHVVSNTWKDLCNEGTQEVIQDILDSIRDSLYEGGMKTNDKQLVYNS